MIRHMLEQFKWRRNLQPFKLFIGTLVAVYVVNPSIAQATNDQQLASGKQLSSQPLCTCAPNNSQYAPQYTSQNKSQYKPHKQKPHKQKLHKQKLHKQKPHKQKNKALHAAAAAPSKHVKTVHSAHSARSAHVVHSVTTRKYYSYSTVQYKTMSSASSHEYKYCPLDMSKLYSNSKIILQAGVFNSSQGRTQDVFVNDVYDIYTVTKHDSQNVLLGLGYYIDGLETPRYGLWYGLNVFYLAPSAVKGDILQEGVNRNLSYRYTVTQFPIYLDIKGIFHTDSPKYDITLDLAAGPSIVSTSDVQEYALNSTSIPDKIFKGSTRILPSVSAGLGLKVNNVFSNKASVECGYRMFYTPQTKFDHYFDSTPTSGPLHTGNNFVNSVMCSIIF